MGLSVLHCMFTRLHHSAESFQNWQISIHPVARESTQGASVSSSSVQNTLKFTAYPNKCAQSEIYIYVMSIALTLASNQETSDSRALILSNLNITSTKWPGNILGRRHLIQKSRAQSQFGSKNKEILWEKKVSAIKLLIRQRSNGGRCHKALIQPFPLFTFLFQDIFTDVGQMLYIFMHCFRSNLE